MLRTLRALLVVALVALLTVGTAGAAGADTASRDGHRGSDVPTAVASNNRRQVLLHRHWPAGGVPGSMLVTAATPAEAIRIASAESGTVVGAKTVVLHVSPGTEAAVAGRIAGRYRAVGIEPDRVRAPAAVPNDPRFPAQWSHRLTNITSAWDHTTGSAAVKVAVLDTGVDARHEDLANVISQVDLSSGHVVTRTNLPVDNDSCNVGHGTFVAGVIGATGNNGTGIAGVAWTVSIVDVALTSAASRCGILDSAIIAGIDYAVKTAHADVINLSLGGVADSCPMALQTALDGARAAGTVVVAAAGNDQGRAAGSASIPASCNGVISVAAVGDAGNVAPYSDENQYVDLAAPGGDSSTGAKILSTTPGASCQQSGSSCYGEEEGTSFASPYVAGAAALLRSVRPSLTVDDVESILEHTAVDRGATGRDSSYGWGLIDVGAAVAAAAAGSPPPPVPGPSFPVAASGLEINRVQPDSGPTEAIAQAVAMSKFTFDSGQAVHAVIARSDDFADALAGSALGFGVGPILFTHRSGPLASATSDELLRVLPTGSTVYLLGGSAALPSTLDGEIQALGYNPVRVAGATRQLTAVAVAEELERFLNANDFPRVDFAVVATAFNWPDAVSAGAIGAYFGAPVLLTSAGSLDPAVRDFLHARSWSKVYVIGGTAAISEDTRRAVRDAAGLASGQTVRLAGADRSSTAVAVAAEYERLFSSFIQQAFGEAAVPRTVVAVNLRRDDGFAHVLSASALLGAQSGVFVPVEGQAGDRISDEAQSYVCRFPAEGVVAGGSDLVSDATATLFDSLLKGDAPACTGSG